MTRLPHAWIERIAGIHVRTKPFAIDAMAELVTQLLAQPSSGAF